MKANVMHEQGDLFRAETTWFHVFHSMIETGDIARMGPYAVTVYLVIKAHTNFQDRTLVPGNRHDFCGVRHQPQPGDPRAEDA